MLLTFAVAMQEGQFGLGRQIKVQSVKAALQAVSQKYALDGYNNPRCTSLAQHALNFPIARLIKKFANNDQPPKPKLAIPVSTIFAIATKYTFSLHHWVVADLILVAFFNQFWVGEYTTPCKLRATHTNQLCKCDVRLWLSGQLLNHESSLTHLLWADSATISITNTQHGTKEAVVRHVAMEVPVARWLS
jgi:hypothetical protein